MLFPQSERPQVIPSKGVSENIYSSNPNIESNVINLSPGVLIEVFLVIPAKAGIQFFKLFWTPGPVLDSDPGFAGVTVWATQFLLS